MNDDCEQCGHPFGPHALVATRDGDPTKGGVIICPEPGCLCFGTWGLPELGTHAGDVVMPDPAEVERMRRAIRAKLRAESAALDARRPLAMAEYLGWVLLVVVTAGLAVEAYHRTAIIDMLVLGFAGLVTAYNLARVRALRRRPPP